MDPIGNVNELGYCQTAQRNEALFLEHEASVTSDLQALIINREELNT